MILGGGIANNANTPAINSQAATATLPAPGYPNRWVLDKQGKKLYVDNGTSLILVLDGNGPSAPQNLQNVTDVGSVTTNGIQVAGVTSTSDITAVGFIEASGGLVSGSSLVDGFLSLLINGFQQTIVVDVATAGDADYVIPYKTGGGVFAMLADLLIYMINPMTAQNDIIVGGVAGAPQALPIGTPYQLLRSDFAGSPDIQWSDGAITVYKNFIGNQIASTGSSSSTNFSFTQRGAAGVNLLQFSFAINFKTVTTGITGTVSITFTDSNNVVSTVSLAIGLIATAQNSATGVVRCYMAKTGTITMTIAITAGNGTYDWMPSIQVLG